MVGNAILSNLYFYRRRPRTAAYNYGHAGYFSDPGLLQPLAGTWSSATAAVPAAATSLSAASTLANATAATSTGTSKLLALVSGIASAAAANPIGGLISFFVGNGADAAADCTGSACNGGNGGIFFGNGGNGANGGNGGNAGFFFGNGGNGGDGVLRRGTTADFVAATAGGNGGHGGFFFGNGGKGGNGGRTP